MELVLAEAEYVALTIDAKKITWLRLLFIELDQLEV